MLVQILTQYLVLKLMFIKADQREVINIPFGFKVLRLLLRALLNKGAKFILRIYKYEDESLRKTS